MGVGGGGGGPRVERRPFDVLQTLNWSSKNSNTEGEREGNIF